MAELLAGEPELGVVLLAVRLEKRPIRRREHGFA
jgi:hypothetical protein